MEFWAKSMARLGSTGSGAWPNAAIKPAAASPDSLCEDADQGSVLGSCCRVWVLDPVDGECAGYASVPVADRRPVVTLLMLQQLV